MSEQPQQQNGDPWWGLSFTDPDRPPGEQHLGTVLVQAADEAGALTESHVRCVNPGGQVLIVGPIPEEAIPPEQPRYRLLTAADMDAIGTDDMAPQVVAR